MFISTVHIRAFCRDDDIETLKRCPDANKVVLHDINPTPELIDVLKGMKIEYLELRQPHMPMIDAHIEVVSGLQVLKTIILDGHGFLYSRPQTMQRVAQALAGLATLSHVTFKSMVFDTASFAPLLQKRLQAIVITSCHVSDLPTLIRDAPGTPMIVLKDVNFTDADVRQIIDDRVKAYAVGDELSHVSLYNSRKELKPDTRQYWATMCHFALGTLSVVDGTGLPRVVRVKVPHEYHYTYRAMHAFLSCDRVSKCLDEKKPKGQVRRLMSEAGDRSVAVRVLRMLLR